MIGEKKQIPTTDDFERLASRAVKGDISALQELGNLNEKLGRRANAALRGLEKAGYTGSEAYKQAVFQLGTKRPRYNQSGKQAKNESIKEAAQRLLKSVKQSARFLRYETSTVGGVRRKTRKGYKKLREKLKASMKEKSVTATLTSKQIESQLDKFLMSDALDEIKATLGSQVITNVAENIAVGADVDELIDMFDKWQSGQTDAGLLTIWDNWVKIN